MEIENTEVLAEGEKRRLKKNKRQLPPDPRSAIYWLKNRRPDLWRDKPPAPPSGPTVIRIRPIRPECVN